MKEESKQQVFLLHLPYHLYDTNANTIQYLWCKHVMYQNSQSLLNQIINDAGKNIPIN
jgi:hypothetical protein